MSAVGTSVQALIQTQTLVLESLSAVQKEKDALEAQLAKAKVRIIAVEKERDEANAQRDELLKGQAKALSKAEDKNISKYDT